MHRSSGARSGAVATLLSRRCPDVCRRHALSWLVFEFSDEEHLFHQYPDYSSFLSARPRPTCSHVTVRRKSRQAWKLRQDVFFQHDSWYGRCGWIVHVTWCCCVGGLERARCLAFACAESKAVFIVCTPSLHTSANSTTAQQFPGLCSTVLFPSLVWR